ncbi:YfhH family protein [Halalkalibacillus sediminis]|nr:YfhH family protein [Halalkalibacillus sediminis]
MERRYSNYTVEELREEIAELTEKARKAEQMGMVNEYAVYQRKMIMAKSYMLDPSQFSGGEVYEIEGAPGELFAVDYLRGVFVWGRRENYEGKVLSEDLEAVPIGVLAKKVQ